MKNKCILAFFFIIAATVALGVFKNKTGTGEIPVHASREDIERALFYDIDSLQKSGIGPYAFYFLNIDKPTGMKLVKDIAGIIFEHDTKNKLLPQIHKELAAYEVVLLNSSRMFTSNKKSSFLTRFNQYKNTINRLNRLTVQLYVLKSYYNAYFEEEYEVRLSPEAETAAINILERCAQQLPTQVEMVCGQFIVWGDNG